MEGSPQWWSLSGEDLLEMLRAVEAGETADMVYATWYANSQITIEEVDEG